MNADAMKMVNGRVSERATAKASRVLESQGLSISAFIRNSIEYVARVGEVPESGFPAKAPAIDRADLKKLIEDLESKPMPGKADYADLDEDELVGHLRMQRYGY